MRIELYCPCCCAYLSADPELTSGDVIDRMAENRIWFALADGDTFEDMIFNAFLTRGDIRCLECRSAASVNEESMGRLSRELFPCC